jgi:hypothetical protein
MDTLRRMVATLTDKSDGFLTVQKAIAILRESGYSCSVINTHIDEALSKCAKTISST